MVVLEADGCILAEIPDCPNLPRAVERAIRALREDGSLDPGARVYVTGHPGRRPYVIDPPGGYVPPPLKVPGATP